MIINRDNYGLSNNDNIVCPQCFELLYKPKSKYENKITNNIEEFIKFNCKKCMNEFCYILCPYCDKKIYMKIHPNGGEYNGLNGFNIYCPYISCAKVFYFTKCIKCQRNQKQKTYIKEGNIIKCIYNDCQCEYIQVNCPAKYCTDIISIEKPKNYTNFPFGIMILHKKEIDAMFQKINCYYCLRPVVFTSNIKHRNKYYECQEVICPYEDCKKKFNRIICPYCFTENYVNDGWYKMGSQIKCSSCKKDFGKILCSSCGKINICKGNYFQSGKIKCGFSNCLKENYMINCIYCRKLNIFNNEIPINGQIIKCGYCHNTFNEIFCPFCNLINPFPLTDFSFGKVYKCKYLTCLKQFQFLICPNCLLYSFTRETQEGKRLKCDDCNILFMNWGCPFCKSTIMDKNTSLHQGQMVKCPSKTCGKIYSFIRCSKCYKLIFSKENENIMGICLKCPYQGCEEYTLINQCPLCKIKTVYSGQRKNLKKGEIVHCPSCKGKYKFLKDNKLYNNKLTILKEIEGETIGFGKAEIDENYLMKQDLFYIQNQKNTIRLYSIILNSEISSESVIVSPNNRPLDVCIVCHNNLKESIFYPCGHRCVCYNCAVTLFEVNKKCPKCNCYAKCIIKKIYE